MNYIFPLETSNVPSDNAGLADMRAFLRCPEDGVFLDLLLKYELPASYEIKRFDDGSAFMCIDIKLSGHVGDVDITKLPLRIAAILAKGMDSEWEPSDGHSQDHTEIVRKALASKDVFVIYGNTGLPKLFSDLVSGILGPEIASFPDVSLDEYKNHLLTKLGAKNKQASSFETAAAQFEQRAKTYEDAIKILCEIYTAALETYDDKSFLELRKIMDVLWQRDYDTGLSKNLNWCRNKEKIKRHIYSLPHNRIKYEDNGKMVLADTIDRLRGIVSTQEEERLLNNLQKLADNETPDDVWFNELADIRKQLMLAYSVSLSPFVSSELREQIMDIFTMYKQNEAAVSVDIRNKSIFEEYINSITNDILDKYRRPFDGTRPFHCSGVCVIDMDACADSIAIGQAFCNAEKVILLGSQMAGVFRSAFLGANAQFAVDGKQRIAFSGMNFPNIKRIPRPNLEKVLESSDIGSTICKLIVFHVIAPLRVKQQLDPVEQAVFKLLKAGYCQTVIEKTLEVNVSYVIKELSHKGLLYPDAMLRQSAEKETYKQGYIFSRVGEKSFFDVWLHDYEEIRYVDIGEACLTKADLPVHYVLNKFETKYKPEKSNRAQKFTEIGWVGCHEYL